MGRVRKVRYKVNEGKGKLIVIRKIKNVKHKKRLIKKHSITTKKNVQKS